MWRIFWIDATVALAAPLLAWIFGGPRPLRAFVEQYLYSVLYANMIGVPLYLTVPYVWERTGRMPMWFRSGLRAGLVVLGNVAGCLAAGLVVVAVSGSRQQYWPEFRSSLGLSLVLSSVVVAYIAMYEIQQSKLKASALQLKTNEVERERALKLATEARLSSLESRVRPHFLFNTINSVSSLIHEDAGRAERMLIQLAALLRFSLDATPGSLVSLSRELQIVEDYLEIERARFGDRLRYSIEFVSQYADVQVPPFSLQTLVENSVKYAATPRGSGATLTVRAAAENGLLWLSVTDDGPGFSGLELPAGHGLNNLQERLLALFGEEAQLSVSSGERLTTVRFAVPHKPFKPAESTSREVRLEAVDA